MSLDKTSDEFETPPWLFNALNDEFNFTTDVAASDANHKCEHYITKEQNSLINSWSNYRAFCNPPYSRGMVKEYFFKCLIETRFKKNGLPCKVAVLLIPTYTERDWYHTYRNHFEKRDIKSRIQFGGGATTARGNHMLLIFRSPAWAWWSV